LSGVIEALNDIDRERSMNRTRDTFVAAAIFGALVVLGIMFRTGCPVWLKAALVG
jgi:hypothetical protein